MTKSSHNEVAMGAHARVGIRLGLRLGMRCILKCHSRGWLADVPEVVCACASGDACEGRQTVVRRVCRS